MELKSCSIGSVTPVKSVFAVARAMQGLAGSQVHCACGVRQKLHKVWEENRTASRKLVIFCLGKQP